MNFYELTAHALTDKLHSGQVSAETLYHSLSQRIKDNDGPVHAYVLFQEEFPGIQDSAPKKFRGLPIAVKDNICVKGMETTCCSRILKGFKPPYDATVIGKLRSQGMVVQGHTNMDEFAFGSSTENSCYGPTHNPWDLTRVPGGSSGGSAAAVAAHEAIWAIGSDTGGSIRQPAAFCGVVGLKPTYGRVSRYGLIAFASSLDQIGPITKDVQDAACLLGILAGHDPMDSTSGDLPVPDYASALGKDIKGLKIGVPKEYFIDGLAPEVRAAVEEAINLLKGMGATIVDISLPHTEYCVATYYIIATAEASSNLARYDGVRYGLRRTPPQPRKSAIVDMFEETRDQGFGEETKRRIMLGTFSLSSGYYDAFYLRGQKVRTLIKNDFDRAFEEVDAIVMPTSPTTAFKIGEKTNDPLAMYLSDIYTIFANLSGVPAISLPCGFSKEGLPIGLQVCAKAFDEEMMLRIAYQYEQKAGWYKETLKPRTKL